MIKLNHAPYNHNMCDLPTDMLFNILEFCTPAVMCNIIVSGAFGHKNIEKCLDTLRKTPEYHKFISNDIYAVVFQAASNPSDVVYNISVYGSLSRIDTNDISYKHCLNIITEDNVYIQIEKHNLTQIYTFNQCPKGCIHVHLANGLELIESTTHKEYYIRSNMLAKSNITIRIPYFGISIINEIK